MTKNNIIIGVDHGYGFVKTANTTMASGVKPLIVPAPFNNDIIKYKDKLYIVGQTRTEHGTDKTLNSDYYILTLAAIAKELKIREIDNTNKIGVTIAAGLPYAFMNEQGESFKRYLLKHRNIEFAYEGDEYSIHINDVYVFSQGFPIIAKDLGKYKCGVSVVDVGSRTIDIITFNAAGKAVYDKCLSIDKRGILDCIEMINDNFTARFQQAVSEDVVNMYLMGKTVQKIDKEQAEFIRTFIRYYVSEVIAKLKAKDIIGGISDVIICGGGAAVLQRYLAENNSRIKYVTDINANAKGFEYLAKQLIKAKAK